MPYLECHFHNVPVLSIVRHVLDFSFTLLAVLLMAQSCMLPLASQLFSTPFAVSFIALSYILSSFLLSSIEGTFCICAPFFHTYSTWPFTSLLSFLVSSTLLHTSLLCLLEFQIYFGKLVSPFSFPLFCSVGLSVQTLCIATTLFFFFLLTLLLVKQGHTFLWESCSWCCDIVVET